MADASTTPLTPASTTSTSTTSPFEQVVDIWRNDCTRRGVALPESSDPLRDPEFEAAIAAAYTGPLSTA